MLDLKLSLVLAVEGWATGAPVAVGNIWQISIVDGDIRVLALFDVRPIDVDVGVHVRIVAAYFNNSLRASSCARTGQPTLNRLDRRLRAHRRPNRLRRADF